MSDGKLLVEHMKQAALGVTDSISPVNILFGWVISTSPLEINVEQRMVLGASQLVLCKHLTNYTVNVEVSWTTNSRLGGEDNELKITGNTDTGGDPPHEHSGETLVIEPSKLGHSHTVNGVKSMTIMNALQPGEQVVLMRMQGGQKFLVMDRVV